ncbi:hypothetical protein M0657_009087 [Pyricularia oryzae]|nr:hypothetical protein M0657_009087 [Pyricularia oryzae]
MIPSKLSHTRKLVVPEPDRWDGVSVFTFETAVWHLGIYRKASYSLISQTPPREDPSEAGAWATIQRPAVLGKSMVSIFDAVIDITHWQTWLTVGEVETTGKAGPVGQVHPVTPGVLLMNFGIVQSKEYLSIFSSTVSVLMSCVCRPSLGFPSLQCGDFLAGGHEIQDCLSGCLPLEGVLAAKLLKYAGNVSLGLNLPIRSLLTAMMQCFHSQYFDSMVSDCPCIIGVSKRLYHFPPGRSQVSVIQLADPRWSFSGRRSTFFPRASTARPTATGKRDLYTFDPSHRGDTTSLT